MRNAMTYVVVAALAATAPGTSAMAQVPAAASRSATKGFNLGVHANGTAHKFDESSITESGGGAGVRLGWGFTDHVMLFAQADVAAVEAEDGFSEYALAHVDLGLRFSFSGPTSAWRPYLDIALGGRGVGMEVEGSDVTFTGSALTGGAGIQYFMTRRLGLDVGLRYSSGKYTEATVDGESYDIDDSDRAMSTRVNIGLSWYPGG